MSTPALKLESNAPDAGLVFSWAGGKSRILPKLVSRLPDDIHKRRYIEPCMGSGALFFWLRPERAILSDANNKLMVAYHAIKRYPTRVLQVVESHERLHREDPKLYYAAVREAFNDQDSNKLDWEFAGDLIYLNCACFNGLYRENRNGEFNVPIGSSLKGRISESERVLAAGRALQKADLLSGSCVEVAMRHADADSFVYFDPPYHGGFTQYTARGFTEDDQLQLARCVDELSGRGVKVMLSNSDTPLMREFYERPQYRVETIQAPRAVNSNGAGRQAVSELLVTNY